MTAKKELYVAVKDFQWNSEDYKEGEEVKLTAEEFEHLGTERVALKDPTEAGIVAGEPVAEPPSAPLPEIHADCKTAMVPYQFTNGSHGWLCEKCELAFQHADGVLQKRALNAA